MKKTIVFIAVFLVLFVAAYALAASPTLRFNLDSKGVATITPDGLKGVPYDFHPYSASDGSLLLGLTWVESDRAQLAFFALPIRYDGQPLPVPVPPPDPTPPPVPPDPVPPVPPVPPDPVVQKIRIVVIEESSLSTVAWAAIRSSTAIRDYAKAGGHDVFFLDKDAKDKTGKTPADYAPWIARAKSLPWICITDFKADLLAEGVCPQTEAGFLEYVQKYGGKTAAVPCPTGTCPLVPGGTR